ncbi:MAG: c-type cytochrome [Gammaproteobacteria bacterium]|nr:c-type cytochrome [Gammaproteobacteria bacterium]
MKNTFLASVIVVICQLMLATNVSAESIDQLVLSMSQKLADLNSLNESIVRGKLRVRLCQYCHGKDGNSVKNEIPNLAQQNPVYLLTQFEYFRTNQRTNTVMNRLAKGLSREERINIALYYASQEVKVDKTAMKTDLASINRGSRIYNKTCVNCHGKKGYGERTLPRIAGQKFEFLSKTLTAYKNKEAVRPDSPMVGVSSGLSEEDILSLANYVSQIN